MIQNKYMFIVFEGIDGSGKSTQLELFAEHLASQNINFVKTKEPGGTDFANDIYNIFHKHDILPNTKLLLINAGRVEHINKVIKPALQQGKIVLCDRFIDSTIVYQGILDNLGIDVVNNLHKTLCDDLQPDLTIYFKVDAKTAITRILSRKTQDSFDIVALQNTTKIIEAYNNLMLQKASNKIIVVNGESSIEGIKEYLKIILLDKLL
jgi:dTMP kinase